MASSGSSPVPPAPIICGMSVRYFVERAFIGSNIEDKREGSGWDEVSEVGSESGRDWTRRRVGTNADSGVMAYASQSQVYQRP